MEILQNVWKILITEDENLIKFVVLLLSIFETFVTMKLFTEILDVKYTKKQLFLYFSLMFIYGIFTSYIIPQTLYIFMSIIIIPIIIKFTFKISIMKSVLAEIVPMILIVIIENIYAYLCINIFNLSPEQCSKILLYRIPIMLLIYLTIFMLSALIKKVKLNIYILRKIDNYRKRILLINLIFLLVLIGIQFYLFIFYNKTLPFYISLISLLSIIVYFCISIYSIIKSINLDVTKENLEQSELHNKTLELLYDNLSSFRHDFSNIITALGGLIYSKDINAIESYYNKILEECHINNNLSTLNPKTINNPAIYNILANKYYKADELGIKINFQVFINLNELKLDVYDFCRILSILLDNAIEAASNCEEKTITIDIHDIKLKKYQLITIENTYSNKNIDINKLYEKGYTSKTENKQSHGIGLWQVSKLLKKYDNINLKTSKDDKFFKQELTINYY